MITIRTIHHRYARCCGTGLFRTDSDALTTFSEGVGLVASDDDSYGKTFENTKTELGSNDEQ